MTGWELALNSRADLRLSRTVAVVGPSGSGKSTLALAIARRLDAALLPADDFLIPEPERTATGLLAKYDLAALDAALKRLQAGRPAIYVPFDQATRRRVGRKVVEPRESGSVVVEGIVALYAARVLATSSLALYVDAPREVREARQLARLDLEGWYRDQPRSAVEARIRAKSAAEDAVVSRQLSDCQYVVDTSANRVRVLRMLATAAA